MANGTVKWFNSTKGYGFIQPENSDEKDVFVHISDVQKGGLTQLDEGQHVSYELKTDKRGKTSASDIQLVSTADTVESS